MARYPEAIADFNRLIELDPEHAWPIGQRGQTHYLAYQYKQALRDLNEAIKLGKDHWDVRKRGEVNLLLGNCEKALQDFELSLKLKADDWTFYERSLAYRTLQQTENAEADIEQAIKLAQQDYEAKPQDCQNAFSLEIYHLSTGNTDKAKRLYQEALEKEPSLRNIKEAVRDIGDLLTVIPSFPGATEIRDYLQSTIETRLG